MTPARRSMSQELGAFLLLTRRDLDVKVRVNDTLVGISDVYFDRDADMIVIELEESSLDFPEDPFE